MAYSDLEFKKELTSVCADGFIPTTSWCMQHGHQKLVDYVYNHGMKWKEALEFYGVTKSENLMKKLDFIAEELRNLNDQLPRIPRPEDLFLNPKLPELSIIKNLFGTWREALDYAGLVHFYETREEVFEALRAIRKANGGAPGFKELENMDYGLALAINRMFSGYKEALAEAGVKKAKAKRNRNARFKTQKEVADAVAAMSENGYLPSSDEVHEKDPCLYSAIYRLFFGGFKDVRALLKKSHPHLSVRPKKKPVRLLTQDQNAFLSQMRALRNKLGYTPQNKKWLVENGYSEVLDLCNIAYGSWRAGRLAFAKYLSFLDEKSP